MSEPSLDDEAVAVEAAALRLLAVREHGRAELRAKLARRGFVADRVESVLHRLEQENLLNESRFVEQYIHSRVRKGYGPLRIRAELGARGVESTSIELGFAATGVDWPEALSDVVRRKYGESKVVERRDLAKRGRQLQQRGFPVSTVRQYLNGLRLSD